MENQQINDPKLPGINDEIITNADENANAEISDEELVLLDEAGKGTDDEELKRADLDNIDEDGEALNEDDDLAGDDLDVPGSEEDDADEMIGEEDEENNSYSESANKDEADDEDE